MLVDWWVILDPNDATNGNNGPGSSKGAARTKFGRRGSLVLENASVADPSLSDGGPGSPKDQFPPGQPGQICNE